MEHRLPWERLLWSGRPAFRPGSPQRYYLTDFRLMVVDGRRVDEMVLHDIAEVHRSQSRLDRFVGTSTVVIEARDGRQTLTLRGIRRGAQFAALVEILAGEPAGAIDAAAIQAALAWDPRVPAWRHPEFSGAIAILMIAAAAAVVGARARPPAVAYSPADPIAPDGRKRPRAEIVRFMQAQVMPWARTTLGRIKGGPDRVTCETCHGRDAAARDWAMPAVTALPDVGLRVRGWELYGGAIDAQIRNAIYGYVAEPQKQDRAGYMRDVVMPGMAALLHRPPYDFTKPYEYNRARLAFGCYHCHRVR